MSYHSVPGVEWLPPCPPVVQWLPVEQTPMPVQAVVDPTAWMDLGWIRVEQEWSIPAKTKVEADGPVQWLVAAGVIGIAALAVYTLAS